MPSMPWQFEEMKGQFAHYLQQWRKETFHSFDVPKKKGNKMMTW
jgi:hypothetical protein